MPHIADARGAKAPFQMGKVLAFVRDIAAATVGKTRKDASIMSSCAMSRSSADTSVLRTCGPVCTEIFDAHALSLVEGHPGM